MNNQQLTGHKIITEKNYTRLSTFPKPFIRKKSRAIVYVGHINEILVTHILYAYKYGDWCELYELKYLCWEEVIYFLGQRFLTMTFKPRKFIDHR